MLSLLFLLLNTSPAQTCSQDLTRILSKDPIPEIVLKTAKDAEVAIGKALTKEQTEALEQSMKKMSGDAYMASDLADQTKLLQKAGLDLYDIDLLRKKNILSNTVIRVSKETPAGVNLEKIVYRDLNAEVLKEIKAGKKFNYLAGENGELKVTKESVEFAKDKMILAQNLSKSSKVETPLLLREAGEISYDKQRRTLVFKPKHAFENNELASRQMIEKVKSLSPEVKASVTTQAKTPASKVLKCLDIISSQSKSKNYIFDRFVADNVVAIGAIGALEMLGSQKRLDSEEGRALLLGDFVGSNANTIVGTLLSLGISKKELGFYSSMSIRAGMSAGGVALQKQFHEGLTKEENQKAVDDVASFNTGHAIYRLFAGHYFDKFTSQKLPNMIFDACQRNPALALSISPMAVRMYERGASAVIYYGARGALVGQ